MVYNEFISIEQVKYYDEIIENDAALIFNIKQFPHLKEVIRAGMYLYDKLKELNCSEAIIVDLQYKAGFDSFSRDTWEVHDMIYRDFVSKKILN